MNGDTENPTLRATRFLDSDHPAIREFTAETVAGETDARGKAVSLYYRVRDEIRYDPYAFRTDPESLIASNILARGRSFCVGKAVLLAAAGRAAGLPTRLGFADVRNHLTSPRLRALMGTDVFYYHGFTEFLLESAWIKATPAFNIELCRKAGVKPLEWEGHEDSVFHEFDTAGQRHMEYLAIHEPATDLPIQELTDAYRHHYPDMFRRLENQGPIQGDFDSEVSAC